MLSSNLCTLEEAWGSEYVPHHTTSSSSSSSSIQDAAGTEHFTGSSDRTPPTRSSRQRRKHHKKKISHRNSNGEKKMVMCPNGDVVRVPKTADSWNTERRRIREKNEEDVEDVEQTPTASNNLLPNTSLGRRRPSHHVASDFVSGLSRQSRVVASEDENVMTNDDVNGELSDNDDGGWAQEVSSFSESAYTPGNVKYHNHFARPNDPKRIPEGIDVALDAAPFVPTTTNGNTDIPNNYHVLSDPTTDESHEDDGIAQDIVLRRRRHPCQTLKTPDHSSTTSEEVHDELEWMRNNLSHLGDRIDQLTCAVKDRLSSKEDGIASTSNKAVQTWSQPIADSFLYIVTGLFVLLVIDIVFKAGNRMSAGK